MPVDVASSTCTRRRDIEEKGAVEVVEVIDGNVGALFGGLARGTYPQHVGRIDDRLESSMRAERLEQVPRVSCEIVRWL